MAHRFYPALGTPLAADGSVLEGSLTLHVEDQVARRAEALLVMGSMGIQPMVRDREFPKVAAIAAKAAKGACPVLVGVMDNSVSRVRDRIDSLRGLRLDGVVATTPYYFVVTQEEAKAFYRAVADTSPFPLYLYDLPGVTQCKLSTATVAELAEHPNIAGIKSNDLAMMRVLQHQLREMAPDFELIYSGLDTFDVAYGYGITRNLDGMFSCTAEIAEQMYDALERGDTALAARKLDDIVGLRNLFVEVGIFPGFTYAMNLLGFEGNFHPDYCRPLRPEQADKVRSYMQKVKLI